MDLNRNMKIAYYTQTFLLDSDFPLIKQLQCKGHDVLVLISLAPHNLRGFLLDIKRQIPRNAIISAAEYPEMQVYAGYLNICNIYFVNRTESSVRSWTYGRLMRDVCRMIKRFNPDVVHVTYPLDTWEMLLLRFRKKMVLTMHDPFPHSGKHSLRSSVGRYLSIKMSPKIVLLNEEQKESFKRFYNVESKAILVNCLGIYDYLRYFNYTPQKEKGGETNILFFGLVAPYKGLEYLCEAMVGVHEKRPDVTLTIAGRGKLYFDYSPYSKLDYIKLTNRYIGMDELVALLNRASFVVCPYKDATQSAVIMTAFGMECPVVASDVGALKEQIKNGETGVLLPPCDVEALSAAIVDLIDSPETLQKMCGNIHRQNTEGESSWEKITDKYIEFYDRGK